MGRLWAHCSSVVKGLWLASVTHRETERLDLFYQNPSLSLCASSRMWKVEDSAAFDWVLTGQLVAWGKKGFGGGLEVSCCSGRPGARSQVKASQDLRNKQTCARGPAACWKEAGWQQNMVSKRSISPASCPGEQWDKELCQQGQAGRDKGWSWAGVWGERGRCLNLPG